MRGGVSRPAVQRAIGPLTGFSSSHSYSVVALWRPLLDDARYQSLVIPVLSDCDSLLLLGQGRDEEILDAFAGDVPERNETIGISLRHEAKCLRHRLDRVDA